MNTSQSNNKKNEEQKLVSCFLRALGQPFSALTPRESPDFSVCLNQRTIGIEVTVYHADEGDQPGGSALRQKEKEEAQRAKSGFYGMWTKPQWEKPFLKRVRAKASKTNFNRTGIDELWLVVCASTPIEKAILSTLVACQFITSCELQKISGSVLEESFFDAAFFYLMLDKKFFEWRKGFQWKGPSTAAVG